jgi:hypothetical protein
MAVERSASSPLRRRLFWPRASRQAALPACLRRPIPDALLRPAPPCSAHLAQEPGWQAGRLADIFRADRPTSQPLIACCISAVAFDREASSYLAAEQPPLRQLLLASGPSSVTPLPSHLSNSTRSSACLQISLS